MLNPSDSIVDWVLDTVPTMGAGWCPPGMLGIGIGGTAEKAMLLAKEALMEPIDIQDLMVRGPSNRAEELRLELYEKVNALGIGAQGVGGLTTVLDIKVKDYPTHAANLPVAMIPNCASTRHAHFTLDGSGPVVLEPPSLEDWPKLSYLPESARQVDLNTITRDEVAQFKPGEVLLLSGKLLTGRDAAHKRIVEMLNKGRHYQLISRIALSTTWVQWILCVMKSSVLRVQPQQRVWISLRVRCWSRAGCSVWWARPSVVLLPSLQSVTTKPCI